MFNSSIPCLRTKSYWVKTPLDQMFRRTIHFPAILGFSWLLQKRCVPRYRLRPSSALMAAKSQVGGFHILHMAGYYVFKRLTIWTLSQETLILGKVDVILYLPLCHFSKEHDDYKTICRPNRGSLGAQHLTVTMLVSCLGLGEVFGLENGHQPLATLIP